MKQSLEPLLEVGFMHSIVSLPLKCWVGVFFGSYDREGRIKCYFNMTFQ